MCLAIPGKIEQVSVDEHGVRMARANFGGVVKSICLECTPEAKLGDYVLVHVGFALNVVDEDEAQRTFQVLKAMQQLSELEDPEGNHAPGAKETP